MFCQIVSDVCNPDGMSTGMIEIRVLDTLEIDARRAELLERVGMSLYELRERAHEYELTLDDLEVLRELENLEFISGEYQ